MATCRHRLPAQPASAGSAPASWAAACAGTCSAKGFAVTVYNRTRDKAQPLLDRGAAWADSPRAVAERSDVVFTMVGFPRDVRQVVLGVDGSLAGARPGSILVDMTTSEPSLAVEIAEAARRGACTASTPPSPAATSALAKLGCRS